MDCALLSPRYESKIRRYMEECQRIFTAAGYLTDLYEEDLDGDWGLTLAIAEQDESPAALRFLIIGSDNGWDAPEDDGINFMVELITFGGQNLGSICPGNYTDAVWVNPENLPEMDRRLADILTCPPNRWLEAYQA